MIRLDATASEALLAQLDNQYWAARARQARSSAELNDLRTLVFADDILQASGTPALADLLETERQLFASRWQSYDGTIALLRLRMDQTREQAAALRAQVATTEDQLGFVTEELNAVRGLYERGFERRPRLLELQRRVAELQGDRSDLLARLALAEQTIVSTELEISQTENVRITEIYAQLQQAQAVIADVIDRMRAARDVVERTVIRAPQAGLVTDLRFFTPGGVIGPGQPILDIVPFDDELVVEAMVSPSDIDSVRPGQRTDTRLTAYASRIVPTVEGTLVHVSADLLTDERTGQSYYSARVRLSPEALAEIDRVRLYPGMPAEVLIVTGERRAIDFFLGPITDTMARAGREQ